MVTLDPSQTADVIAQYLAQDEEMKRVFTRLWMDVTRPFGGFEEGELIDRDRGILSKTDRRYLVGEGEYEHVQSETNRKRTIRDRIGNSLQDYFLLFWFLPPEERQKVVDSFDREQFEACAATNIAFLYKLFEANTEAFERIIEDGIARFQHRPGDGSIEFIGDLVDVSVDIDIETRPSVDQLESKFEDGERLTDSEIGALVRTGYIGESELRRIQGEDTEESSRLE